MAFIDQLNQLAAAKADLAKQEKELEAERTRALTALPAQFGYSDLNAFIKALKKAPKAKKVTRTAKKTVKKGKRARLTPEAKQAIVEAVKGEKTGAEIAKEFGVSLATVHNLKKTAGLVKARWVRS